MQSPRAGPPDDEATTRRVLDAVAATEGKGQRSLAREAGVSLGLANAYLRRCMRKGWIKVRQVPARRYLYYLTPHGFAEKARLTAEYLTVSLDLFRQARQQYDGLLDRAEASGFARIVVIGAGDLAEIATLSTHDREIRIVAVIDPASNQGRVAGVPVLRSLAEAAPFDAALIADIRDPEAARRLAAAHLPDDRILVPALLGLAPGGNGAAGG